MGRMEFSASVPSYFLNLEASAPTIPSTRLKASPIYFVGKVVFGMRY